MAPKISKEHEYNVKKLAEKMPYPNAYQKLNIYLSQGVDYFKSAEEIDQTIEAMQNGVKEIIADLKRIRKNHH